MRESQNNVEVAYYTDWLQLLFLAAQAEQHDSPALPRTQTGGGFVDGVVAGWSVARVEKNSCALVTQVRPSQSVRWPGPVTSSELHARPLMHET